MLDRSTGLCYNKDTKGKEITTMWEYDITNKETNEREIISGYWLADAFRRSKLNPDEWVVMGSEYID